MKKNKLIKLTSTFSLASALLLGATACSSQSKQDEQARVEHNTKQTKKANTQNKLQLKKVKINISQDEAVKKFNDEFPDAKITAIELKKENGNYIYKIEGFTKMKEHEARIDAQNGDLLGTHSEHENTLNKKYLNLSETISRDEATKIAEKEVKNSIAEEWELEQEQGRSIWNVKVNDGTATQEIEVDAETKKVIQVENDD